MPRLGVSLGSSDPPLLAYALSTKTSEQAHLSSRIVEIRKLEVLGTRGFISNYW